jgi:hypothetical protein
VQCGSSVRLSAPQGVVYVIMRVLAAFLIAVSIVSCAKQKTYEENYETAEENAATKPGAAYDNALGAAVQGTPGFMLVQRDCVIKNPGGPSLHGYILIKSQTEYSVVLEPKGALADCIEATLTNRTLPVPPSTPYLNPVEFAATQ